MEKFKSEPFRCHCNAFWKTSPVYPWTTCKVLHFPLLCPHCIPIILYDYAAPCSSDNVCRVNMFYRQNMMAGVWHSKPKPTQPCRPLQQRRCYVRWDDSRLWMNLSALYVCVAVPLCEDSSIHSSYLDIHPKNLEKKIILLPIDTPLLVHLCRALT